MGKIELLSPAGDLERLKIAFIYGADACYIGGKDYSLRANANNFSISEIKEACDFAHKLGKKVYLTLNIVFHNEDIDGVYDYIKKVVDAGIDAFIVSDIFIVNHITKNYKNVEVHLSTQDSTTNKEAVKYLKREGVKRVVLGREVSLDETAEIIKETGVDIEIFIHGAMCTFYSGRCVLSNYFTNRDSNRGGCSQVCRYAFSIDGTDDFAVSVKDLNASYLISKMIDMGVKSLKIEGRMRSPYYLATVLSSYRRIIDNYYNGTLTEEQIKLENKILGRVSNRENSTHFYERKANLSDQYYTNRQELTNQDYLGIVKDYDKENKLAKLQQRNYFKVGDNVEVITPDFRIIKIKITEIYDEKMNKIDTANQADTEIFIKTDEELPEFSMMRKTND